MEGEIIQKLNDFLNEHSPVTKECQVIYLMVEIRKLIEIFNNRSNYSTLFLYCNWTLHPIIDRTNLLKDMQDLISRIDESIQAGGKFDDKQLVPSDFGSSLIEFSSLGRLKENMQAFFNSINLPLSLFEDVNWGAFRNHLLRVLCEQPIIFKNPSTNIKSICFKFANVGAVQLQVEFVDNGAPFRYIGTL
jgi:hypothetical protein